MARPKKDTFEQFAECCDNARMCIGLLPDEQVRVKFTSYIDSLELDFRKYYYGETAHETIIIANPIDGSMITLDRSKAQLFRWRDKDPDGYRAYAQRLQDLLAQFKPGSLLHNICGSHGEYVLPPEITQKEDNAHEEN